MRGSNLSPRCKNSRLKNGTRYSPSICHPPFTRRAPRDGEEKVGAHYQRCLGPRTGSLAVQVGLCRRQARYRWANQGHCAETAELGITCNAICPGYVWTPLVEAQIESQAKAHGIA